MRASQLYSVRARHQRRRPAWVDATAGVLAALVVSSASGGEMPGERRNWFDTPFGPAVVGLAACPRPEGPLITEDEMRRQAHGRIERGTSCWLAKQCEDSNAYQRDPEIQQRVVDVIGSDPAFADSSVWVTTERRWVTLQGCLGTTALRSAEVAMRRICAAGCGSVSPLNGDRSDQRIDQ